MIYLAVFLTREVTDIRNDVKEMKSVIRHTSNQLSQDSNLIHKAYDGYKHISKYDDDFKDIVDFIADL